LYLNEPLGTLRSYASRNLQVLKHKGCDTAVLGY
jgi:hypothetical protein